MLDARSGECERTQGQTKRHSLYLRRICLPSANGQAKKRKHLFICARAQRDDTANTMCVAYGLVQCNLLVGKTRSWKEDTRCTQRYVRIRKVETILASSEQHSRHSTSGHSQFGPKLHAHRTTNAACMVQLRGYLCRAHRTIKTTTNKLRTRFSSFLLSCFSSPCFLCFWPRSFGEAMPLTLFLFRLIDRQQTTNGCFIHFEQKICILNAIFFSWTFDAFAVCSATHCIVNAQSKWWKNNNNKWMRLVHIVSHEMI